MEEAQPVSQGNSRGFLERFAQELERNPRSWLTVFCGFVTLLMLPVAMRPMWFDELYTYYIARLPGVASIWSALKHGIDLNPPLLYLATKGSQALFGTGPVATRVPEMIGFVVMLLCVYRFVARRLQPVFAFAAIAFPLLTGAFSYGTEARAYGLVLGFTGLALIAWQGANQGDKRKMNLPVLTVSLALALLTHCYAVLIFVPFAAAQVVADYDRRRIDWGVWLAIVGSLPALLVYFPLLTAWKGYSVDSMLFRPDAVSIPHFYRFLLGSAAWGFAGAIAILVVARGDGAIGPSPFLKRYEIACAIGFTLLPVCGVLLGFAVTHIFLDRYGLPAVIGFAILFAAFASHYAGARPATGSLLFLLLAGCAVANYATPIVQRLRADAAPSALKELDFSKLGGDLPVVISNPLQFLELDHYAPAAVEPRLYYLTNRKAALLYTSSDIFDRSFARIPQWFPLRANICDYDTFLRAHPHFLVFGPNKYQTVWLTRKLLADGAQARFLGEYQGEYGSNLLLDVSVKSGEPSVSRAAVEH